MAGDHRITYTRRHAFRTKSNKVKTIRTPGMMFHLFFSLISNKRILFFIALGGRHAAQYMKKMRKGVLCGDCKISLPGVILKYIQYVYLFTDNIFIASQIKHMDARGFKNCKKREKTVSRAYGGSQCGLCVRQRLVCNRLFFF